VLTQQPLQDLSGLLLKLETLLELLLAQDLLVVEHLAL
jgi:hypothetical protein